MSLFNKTKAIFLFAVIVAIGVHETTIAPNESIGGVIEDAKREPLRGLSAFVLYVDNSGGELRERDQEALRSAIEFKIRSVGIRILGNDESSETLGSPYLQVWYSVIRNDFAQKYECEMRVSLTELVIPIRRPDFSLNAVVYEIKNLEFYNSTAEMRNGVLEMVDIFLNDYLTVNPKE